MRWMVGGVLLCVAAMGWAEAPQASPAGEAVGVTERVFQPLARRNWRGAEKHELRCTVWYPAAAGAGESVQVVGPPAEPLMIEGEAAPHAAMAPALEKRPLIVLSHGAGGSAAQMAWLGIALARSGMIAVAVDHPGNNSLAPYTLEGFTLWWERATDASEVIDGMLADEDFGPRIDTRLIGAAGFSLGGYTVLELAGARTDFMAVGAECKEHPEAEMCHAPEMKDMPGVGSILERVRKTSGESLARSADSFRDPRVKAVFAIAPAMGMALTPESLRGLRVPVEEVVGAADTMAPAARNADLVRQYGHGVREVVLPGGVGHYTFLDTCTDAGRKQMERYCTDAPEMDRDAVHTQVSRMAVEFFERQLKWR